jgi:diguanylate cyclase (GGDEF)-like protein/PAS domain S-box-containing protein
MSRPIARARHPRQNPADRAGDLARRYRTLLEHLPQTAVLVFDRDLTVQLVAGPALRLAGLRADQVEGRPLSELLPPQTAATLLPHYRRALAGEEVSLQYRSALDGRAYWLALTPLRDSLGEVEAAIAMTLDVTDRVAAHEALRASEERFRRIFEHAPIGMALLTLDGTIRRVNAALCSLTGHQEDRLVGRALAELAAPGARSALAQRLALLAAGTRRLETGALDSQDESLEGDLALIHAAGHQLATVLRVVVLRDGSGQAEHLLAQLEDITERQLFEQELSFAADHDPLTGLLNRRGFAPELADHMARVEQLGAQGALIVLDLDHFKRLNDALGYTTGDEVICAAAANIARMLQERDVLARLDGDEFAVLAPSADRARAVALAEQLRALIASMPAPAAPRDMAGALRRKTGITASVGVAIFASGLSGEEMLMRADVAMCDSKEHGRDRVTVYNEDGRAHQQGRRSLGWPARIRRAIAQDRLALHAQPIISLRTERPAMHELLLRMVDDQGTLLAPTELLRAAERLEMIGEIDRWVIARAIDALAQAQEDGPPLPVAINVSGRSLGDAGVLEETERLLRTRRVAPELLIFEVTETAVIANVTRARGFAERLRGLGCRFALDDFGSGFNSLYYLKHLPFDLLKIEGEFVRGCLLSATDRLLVEAVVMLARGLGKLTIAERTPDRATLRFLATLGVDFSQSYITGRPSPITSAILRGSEAAQPAADGALPL